MGMLNLVRRTTIGAVVSQLAAADAGDLRLIPLDSPKPLRTPGLLWKVKKPQPSAITAFTAVIRGVVSDAKMKPPK